jgi:hypothetical protein
VREVASTEAPGKEVALNSVLPKSILVIALTGLVVGGPACGSSSDSESGGNGGVGGDGGSAGGRGEPVTAPRSRQVEVIWDSWRVNDASSVEAVTPFRDNLELAAWGFIAYRQYSDPSDDRSEVVLDVQEFVEIKDRLEFTGALGDLPNPIWRLDRKVAEFTEYCDLGDPLLAIDLYEVDQDLDDFQSELEEKAIDVGGVLAGAAAGAAVGSVFPGLGNLVGGIIGGGVVLVAGWFEQWLNTDDGLGRTFTSSDPIQIQTELYLEDGENGFVLDGKSDSRSILRFTKNVISGSCD